VPALKFFISEKLYNQKSFRRQWNDPNQPEVVLNDEDMNGVKDIKWPGVDQALLEREQRLENLLDSESGIPEYAQAESSGETATMTAARDRMMGAQLSSDKEAVSDIVRWWAGMTVAIWREMGTTEQFLRIVGDEGRDWQRFSPADIPYGISWLVDSDSLAPTRRELEKKQQMELIGVLSQFAVPEPLIRMRSLLASLIRKFNAGPEDLSEVFVTLEEQMGQAMAAQQQIAAAGGMPVGPGGPGPGSPMNAGVAPEGYNQGAELAASVRM